MTTATPQPATLLANRALIRLSPLEDGEDVRGFLQGLVTNDTRDIAPGRPVWAALLTAQGKAQWDFLLWDEGASVLIDCEADQADALARRLTLYRLRRKIGIERVDGQGVHWSVSDPNVHLRYPCEGGDPTPDGAASTQQELGSRLRGNDEAKTMATDPRLPELGYRWIGAAEGPDASEAWRAHRLRLGVPEGVAELGADQTLWLETNAADLHGVSFAKGCYVGQENTARMNWRQKVNRRLAVVPLDRSDPKRQRIAYPELGLAVDHLRVEDMAALPLPEWQRAAIAQESA